MKKVSKKQKKLLCYLGLLVIFILMGNSNNVPEVFAERIFKPIRPANNSQVKYKKIILIKNCMTNKPFQNTNDYKIWIF
ncbi:MAG: hypothetical protein SPH93_10965 [Clostridium sp.]|uniref:hypothetical protein n=1 Tax=Clostridium sp. TaxID=1506 RepID=UPI002A913EF7|nr:hypothetical protein [Clostridium sp.]MDY6228157.1 hypothetical protein [Clostridium sp.]